MFYKIYPLLIALLLMLFGTACSEYNRILKSADVDEKYEYVEELNCGFHAAKLRVFRLGIKKTLYLHSSKESKKLLI